MSNLSQLIWDLVYNRVRVTFLSGYHSQFQQEMIRGKELLKSDKKSESDIVPGGGSADELLPLFFSNNRLKNSSCWCSCRDQACEQDGDSDVKSCASVEYLWPLL